MSHQSDLIATDIESYLHQHERKDLLRLLTCGSVDDGKSTLIGRLLHDSQMIYEDQLAAIESDSARHGTTGEEVDLALLVDGLQSEREQGITIDVAYRYFSTDKRKFIIADTPGHEQYTRNMATGASTANLAVILIDARFGVQTQTRRHSYIVNLLGIQHVVVAVNKMDLVDHDRATFERIRDDYLAFAAELGINDVRVIPLSALKGDNVVSASPSMPWFEGDPLMTVLENAPINRDTNFDDLRLPVQYVNRPDLDFRGYCGTLAGGVVRPGDAVQVLPSGKTSRVERIVTFEGDVEEAFPPMSVTLTLEDEIDISRGDLIAGLDNPPRVADRLEAQVIWMTEEPLRTAKRYLVKRATSTTAAHVREIHHQVDVNTLEKHPADELPLNGIGLCRIDLETPMAVDPYDQVPGTGSFIIIDPMTNVTVGAGLIREATQAGKPRPSGEFSEFELELNALIRKHFPHWEARDLRELAGDD